jgi:hypothetical protein
MPAFKDIVSVNELKILRAYIISAANDSLEEKLGIGK